MEIDFKRPKLSDKELISKYFRSWPSRGCDRSFANVYLWSRHEHVGFAEIGNTLVFQRNEGEKFGFAWPAGKKEDIKKTIEVLRAYAKERNQELFFYHLTPENFEILEELEPGKWEITYHDAAADYIYDREKLATLGGKKLHGKRNHINKFKSIYKDWSYETLSDENVEECFQMALTWRNANGCEDDPEKNKEMCVALNSLRLHKELGLVGGILRVNGKIVAYTMGEELCEDTFVVHIEKALTEIGGAYPMINQQFIQHECEKYTYVNREEDMGEEGLRRAKQSYRPVMMVEKGVAREK